MDTNVLASGIAGISRAESTPGELLRRWRAAAFLLVVSEPILTELSRTLTNPYFRSQMNVTEIERALAEISAGAQIQLLTLPIATVATHPEDDAILATALSAEAPFLVTGDKALLAHGAYRGTTILSQRQFLDVLERQGAK